METNLITLTAATSAARDGTLLEIVVNAFHITHFHKSRKKEQDFTYVYFSGGEMALVTQTVEELKEMIKPSQKTQNEVFKNLTPKLN